MYFTNKNELISNQSMSYLFTTLVTLDRLCQSDVFQTCPNYNTSDSHNNDVIYKNLVILTQRSEKYHQKKMLKKTLYNLVPATKHQIHSPMFSKGQNLSSTCLNIYYVQLIMETFWIINKITRFNNRPQHISLTSVFRKISFYRQHHSKYEHLLLCVMN